MRLVSEDRLFGRRVRFLREINLSRRLAAAGIRTPAVLAGVAYPSGIAHTADVATERLDGRDLADLFFGDAPPEGEARAAILQAVGRLVRSLHDAGWVHPDLQLRNVLVAPPARPPVRPSAWLLDVDTCRRVLRGDRESRRANLARFDRSWAKWNTQRGARLLPADRAEFEAGYTGQAP
jgi:hypothetical protein